MPPIATAAHASALAATRSPNTLAPIGTMSSGARPPMNSAWAIDVSVIAVKNSVMLSPKQTPGRIARRHCAAVMRMPLMAIHPCHRATAMAMRQNATAVAGASAIRTIEELLENARMATTIAASPVALADRTGTSGASVSTLAVVSLIGCAPTCGPRTPIRRPRAARR